MIHFGRLQNSDRYRMAKWLVGRARGCTSIELSALGDCAPHSTFAELRAAGYPIAPAEYEGRTEMGRKIYRYCLERKG